MSPHIDEKVGVQRRTTGTIHVWLGGYALRVGFPIPVPELLTINGIAPTLDNRIGHGEHFTQAIVGNTGLSPIVRATWWLHYVIDDPKGDYDIIFLPESPLNTET